MAQSVKKYFQEKHEDEIFNAIDDRIQNHPEDFENRFGRLHRIGEMTLEEIEVMTVYTVRRSDDVLSFDIAVRATVECDEGDYHYDDSRETSTWYTVTGTGSLDCLLEDFNITSVLPYDERRRHSTHALKDTFVPDIRKENLDTVAEQVLAEYYPEALERPMPIDIGLFLRRINLKKIERRISADCSIFGRIYSDNDDPEFYDYETGRFEKINVTAGTILVDPMVFFLRNLGSVKNTIIHECVHWIFHRPLYVLEKISDSSLKQIDCAMAGGIRGRKWSTAREIEWQANALTPRIQMPVRTFRRKADALIAKAMSDYKTDSVLDVIELVIEQLAQFFEVSKLSVKIRMVELGYEVARGAMICVDGKYVKPHMCKPGFLKDYQTFSIEVKDFLRLSLQDYDLREDPRSREFVYIDSHLVYDRPKYVHHTHDGMEMTPYALKHMDECCLVFDLEISGEFEGKYHTVCFLNREEDSPIVFTAKYSAGLDAAGQKAKDKAEREAMNDAYEVLKTLPGDYASALTKLIDESDMDVDDIADETGVSTKTIEGMMRGAKKRGSYESLAYVCLSLQLHPAISEFLISNSPWRFDIRSAKDRALREVLNHFYGHKMSFIHSKIASLSLEE